MTKLILASNSPRRKQILNDHGFKFQVKPANIDEEKYTYLNPIKMVQKLSLLKAEKISNENPKSIIIGADTTVMLENENIGKPNNLSDAKKTLLKLSNSTHTVHTGFTIINPSKNFKKTSFSSTTIVFKKMSENEIDKYIKSHDVLDFAGGYAIQEDGDEFVKNYSGDYLNILGLPTKAITLLKKELE